MRDAPQLHFFAAAGGIPNSRLPLLFWSSRAPVSRDGGDDICRLYERNGWHGCWIYTVFPYWHFHTRGHEVLTCVAGNARLGLGGQPGFAREVTVGDVIVIPAGVGHRRIGASRDFLMAGAYPPGQEGNIVRPGDMSEEEIERQIAALPYPRIDPISGTEDGVVEFWRKPVVQ